MKDFLQSNVRKFPFLKFSPNKAFKRSMRRESVMGSAFNGGSELFSYKTGAILALHRGTLHRTVRTKDAAIAWLGAQQHLAASAFIEELADVSSHRFALGEAANRAHQHGF